MSRRRQDIDIIYDEEKLEDPQSYVEFEEELEDQKKKARELYLIGKGLFMYGAIKTASQVRFLGEKSNFIKFIFHLCLLVLGMFMTHKAGKWS